MSQFIVLTIKGKPTDGKPNNLSINTQWSDDLPTEDVVKILESTLHSIQERHAMDTGLPKLYVPNQGILTNGK